MKASRAMKAAKNCQEKPQGKQEPSSRAALSPESFASSGTLGLGFSGFSASWGQK
jgi:hypothetical protein